MLDILFSYSYNVCSVYVTCMSDNISELIAIVHNMGESVSVTGIQI